MSDLSKAQQRLLDSIKNVYPEERFQVSRWPHLFITDGRGSSVDTRGVKLTTWDAISDRFTKVGWDHFGSWFVIPQGDNDE